jgi:hypothetical protein
VKVIAGSPVAPASRTISATFSFVWKNVWNVSAL